MQRVLNFSGGKTSAYMTLTEYKPGDIVLFCDTGREHPKTYKFINDFEAFENIPVIRIGGKDSFYNYLASKNHNHIPNMMKRSCTIELKIKPARRYMRSLGFMAYENIIGFRADEPKRVLNYVERWKQVTTKFPLYEKQITKHDVNDFWNKKDYTLEIPSILGNCTLCFMKGKSAIMAILREYPELADPWINDENEARKSSGHTYIKGATIEQLRDMAQNNLFKDYNLDKLSPGIDCACTS